MVNQKEAVFAVVSSLVGEIRGAVELTGPQRDAAVDMLVTGFKNGEIQLSTTYDDKKLRQYVVGLLNNWLRKDTRLNGGESYVPRNPGSRAGSGDAQLKALRALMSTLVDPEDKAEVQKHIDARVSEIEAAKQPTIDYSKLPPELAAKFKKN